LRQSDKPARIRRLDFGQIIIDEPALIDGSVPFQKTRKRRESDARFGHISELQIEIISLA
jgi:hypothetical protein